MAAVATVAEIEVLDAGEKIIAEGRRVTAYSLRLALGRGDPRRLITVWDKLQVAAEGAVRIGPAPAIPEAPTLADLPDDVAATATQLRDRIAADLDRMAASMWATADKRARVRLDAEVAAATAVKKAAADDADMVAALLAEADDAKQAALTAAERAADDARAQRERADTAEARAGAAERERDRVDILRVDAERRAAVAEAELARLTAHPELASLDLPEADQLPMLVGGEIVALASEDDALPIVTDRLAVPKPQRDAYDVGFNAGRAALGSKLPKRFQDPAAAAVVPYHRAGYRDGTVKRHELDRLEGKTAGASDAKGSDTQPTATP